MKGLDISPSCSFHGTLGNWISRGDFSLERSPKFGKQVVNQIVIELTPTYFSRKQVCHPHTIRSMHHQI